MNAKEKAYLEERLKAMFRFYGPFKEWRAPNLKGAREMTDENTPHIIITGDPLDGFKFYGPFKDWDEACEIAEADDCLSESVWWCAALESLPRHNEEKEQ